MKKIYIKDIVKNSIAEEMDIERGDYLISVNNTEINDILDYKFQIFDEYITLLVEKANGEEWELEIEKEENEDIGLIFNDQLIEPARACANKCIFCFMDQLPPNVRETLVFKDDDFRLSFMTGNYVTLTNSGYKDLDRIIKYHLSPINISVHATDEETRIKMLNNKNAGKILEYIKYLTDNGIYVNAQIVLCPGINDGKILDKTIEDLSVYFPNLLCIAIVPVGITKYRENLYKIEPFNQITASAVINQVETWQKKFKKDIGSNIVYLADEFYILAEKEIPEYERYEDFPQLEDGIGMLAKFKKEFEDAYQNLLPREIKKTVSIATGKISYQFIRKLANKLEEKFEGLKINIYAIENDFFGPLITVTGLIVGTDLINQLKDKELGECLILASNMLKDDTDIFLDNTTLSEINQKLNIPIKIADTNGESFINTIIE